ncbi:hypothetical protein [Mangrovivirga cuniculi]|uniref:Uncharacterized protein n=1 Tax=Mangrovivirga cuniculi TaxID=2715131 RepID=A0A4D7JMT5_9BACT|nr:hypothetical protein [Mangrovivirga cuniculi]QCK13972.1 hypothetical protein DCC35_03995 [Mangrovivirga cuniculi]
MDSSEEWLLPKEKTEFRQFLDTKNIATSEKHSGLKSTVEKFRTLFNRANIFLYYIIGFFAVLFIPLSLVTNSFQTGICLALATSVFIANWSVTHYPRGFFSHSNKKMQKAPVNKQDNLKH